MEILLPKEDFEEIRQWLHRHVGITLADGKRQLVQSRLQRRLQYLNIDSFAEYREYVKTDPDELREMTNSLTTNKTEFYREAHHFRHVAEKFIPELIKSAKTGLVDRKLRVWHAGCSTGEEPYTLSIVLHKHLLSTGSWDVRLLASDIDTNVLEHAKQGVYDEDRLSPISIDERRRYFLRGCLPNKHQFRVRDELRSIITFRQINLIQTPWPIRQDVRFDMIFCRNVMIYFDKATQRQLFQRFAQLLKPNGLLFLGHSETMLGQSDQYTSLGQTIFKLSPASSETRAA